MKGGKVFAGKKFVARERALGLGMLIGSGMLAWLVLIFLTSLLPHAVTQNFILGGAVSGPVAGRDFLLGLALALILVVLWRRRRSFGTMVAMFLAFLLFSGLTLFVGASAGFFLATGLVLWERRHRSFMSNNLLLLAAVTLGAIPIGLTYPIAMLMFILVFLSLYDLLGVFATHFIPRLAGAAVRAEVPLGLLAPRASVSWWQAPKLENSSALLGSGDLFLPAIFLAAVTANHDIPLALLVFGGALLGGVVNFLLALIIRSGIPAMPLLTVGMIVAYYLAI